MRWGLRRAVLAFAVFVVVCGPGLSSAAAPPSIRKRDWKNGAYDLGDGRLLFADGRHAEFAADGSCSVCLTIRDVTFGDVDGDGTEEAILLIDSNLGGPATSMDGYVFGMVDGEPVLRAHIEGGDRGEGGLQTVSVAAGDVIVRRFHSRSTDGACCPSRVVVERWHWQGGQLLKVPEAPRVRKRKPRAWYLRP